MLSPDQRLFSASTVKSPNVVLWSLEGLTLENFQQTDHLKTVIKRLNLVSIPYDKIIIYIPTDLAVIRAFNKCLRDHFDLENYHKNIIEIRTLMPTSVADEKNTTAQKLPSSVSIEEMFDSQVADANQCLAKNKLSVKEFRHWHANFQILDVVEGVKEVTTVASEECEPIRWINAAYPLPFVELPPTTEPLDVEVWSLDHDVSIIEVIANRDKFTTFNLDEFCQRRYTNKKPPHVLFLYMGSISQDHAIAKTNEGIFGFGNGIENYRNATAELKKALEKCYPNMIVVIQPLLLSDLHAGYLPGTVMPDKNSTAKVSSGKMPAYKTSIVQPHAANALATLDSYGYSLRRFEHSLFDDDSQDKIFPGLRSHFYDEVLSALPAHLVALLPQQQAFFYTHLFRRPNAQGYMIDGRVGPEFDFSFLSYADGNTAFHDIIATHSAEKPDKTTERMNAAFNNNSWLYYLSRENAHGETPIALCVKQWGKNPEQLLFIVDLILTNLRKVTSKVGAKAIDNQGNTLMHVLTAQPVSTKRNDVLKKLCELQAVVNQKNNHGKTPFDMAQAIALGDDFSWLTKTSSAQVEAKQDTLQKQMLTAIWSQCTFEAKEPTSLSLTREQSQWFTAILTRHADESWQNPKGDNGLHIAAYLQKPELYSAIYKTPMGAQKNHQGETPFDYISKWPIALFHQLDPTACIDPTHPAPLYGEKEIVRRISSNKSNGIVDCIKRDKGNAKIEKEIHVLMGIIILSSDVSVETRYGYLYDVAMRMENPQLICHMANWLIKKGFHRPSDATAWDHASKRRSCRDQGVEPELNSTCYSRVWLALLAGMQSRCLRLTQSLGTIPESTKWFTDLPIDYRDKQNYYESGMAPYRYKSEHELEEAGRAHHRWTSPFRR